MRQGRKEASEGGVYGVISHWTAEAESYWEIPGFSDRPHTDPAVKVKVQ